MTNQDEPIVDVENAFSKTELFIEENKKSLTLIVLTIIALVGGYFAWKYWYVAGQEVEAQKEMFTAESYFEKDSLDKAINGDGEFLGFVDIADKYSITASGNLAQYYLGISYLRKGAYEKAIEHLTKFDSDDQIIAPIAIGAIGDAHHELGQAEEAATYYLKAAEKNTNNFTTPVYLQKAGLAYEEMKNYTDALKVYKRIKTDFLETTEGRSIDKYIARAEALIK